MATGPLTLVSIAQWPDCVVRFVFLTVGMVCTVIVVFAWLVKVTDQDKEKQTGTSKPQRIIRTAERDIY